jgi:hypothetical protein
MVGQGAGVVDELVARDHLEPDRDALWDALAVQDLQVDLDLTQPTQAYLVQQPRPAVRVAGSSRSRCLTVHITKVSAIPSGSP